MKTLTLIQPFATLVAIGAKKIETRSWSTKYRGPLAIHSAKSFPSRAQDQCWANDAIRAALIERFGQIAGTTDFAGKCLERGTVVAMCELVDVARILSHHSLVNPVEWAVLFDAGHERVVLTRDHSEVPRPPRGEQWVEDVTDQLPFGDFTPGRFAWLLRNIKPLDEPIPAKGRLGLWEWEGQAR